MDRNKKTKLLTSVCLILGLLLATPAFSATPEEKEGSPQASAKANNVVSAESTTDSRYPHLQRALVIGIIVNFMIIVFATLFYIVKRRMNQFSPLPVKTQTDKKLSSQS